MILTLALRNPAVCICWVSCGLAGRAFHTVSRLGAALLLDAALHQPLPELKRG